MYLQWVEDQVEAYKERVSRADLLALADQVIEELRVNQRGQYQITELLLCDAVDRRIFQMLKLPNYQAWCAAYAAPPPSAAPVDPTPAAVAM